MKRHRTIEAHLANKSPRVRAQLLRVDWRQLSARYQVSRCAYHWVDDASIARELDYLVFDDPAVPHTPETHRARRIASIIRLMDLGVVFDPLQLTIAGRKAHLKDGHHRLRAYQYRNALDGIPVVVREHRRPSSNDSRKNALLRCKTR